MQIQKIYKSDTERVNKPVYVPLNAQLYVQQPLGSVRISICIFVFALSNIFQLTSVYFVTVKGCDVRGL